MTSFYVTRNIANFYCVTVTSSLVQNLQTKNHSLGFEIRFLLSKNAYLQGNNWNLVRQPFFFENTRKPFAIKKIARLYVLGKKCDEWII